MKAVLSGAVRRALLGLTTVAVATGSIAVHAQSTPDEPNSAQLDIPKDLMVFGKSDPNVRTATAIINGQIITGTDVDQRLALVIIANGGKVEAEERDRLRLQVLRNIIDETLQIQEAAANDIRISPAEIDQSFARVAGNFKSTPEGFADYLKKNGSSPASIKRQIEGELAWQRVLRRKVQPYVNVSQDEVNGVIDRMKQSKGSEEFRVGEIYLSSTPENSGQIAENARKIIEQIKQGGSFQAYARQYSEASTAAVGGDLGWVRPAQLPEELAATVQQMSPGQIGGPVALPGGFSILYLIDKRRVLAADPRDATLSLKQIGINFQPGTTPAQAKAVADKFAAAIKGIQGCGAANGIAQKLGAEVVDNDGVKIRDLPPQLQNIMLSLQVGQSTPPFGAVSDGVRVLVLCGRDDAVEGQVPSFDQVMSQMEDDRVNKRARIYLRDLRRDAIIEYN
ncbi:MAG TPA: peptidylprolyl isomerase [Sphingobium sp.]|uniref:peptidylprolyl isomerase n=1 Tax=Sphingobium sp. TaxID=1912891 RepID=UPI002ECFD6A7